MTTAKKKVTVGKIKVLTNHVKNLYRAVDNYYQKGFYLEKKLCASVGLMLKRLKTLEEALKELETLLPLAPELSEDLKKKVNMIIEDAQRSIQKAREIKKRLKEFSAAANIYKKYPTEENKKRLLTAIENLKYPTEGNKTLYDYVKSCNPWKKIFAKLELN
jgi:dsDNA-specific endonuclease/ATPase MutS2